MSPLYIKAMRPKHILTFILLFSCCLFTQAQSIINKLNISTNGVVYALAIDETRNILYLGGSFTEVGGQSRNNLAAIDLNSSTVTTWNPGTNNIVYSMLINNSILYIGGSFTSVGGLLRNRLASFHLDNPNLSSWN